MIKIKNITGLVFLIGTVMLVSPSDLWATQAHGGSEGIVAHQLGHLFFMVSMGMFVYWLGKGRIFSHRGWRYIMMFAILLVVWNLDVVVMHFLDEQAELIKMTKTGLWTVHIDARNGSGGLALLYYLGKMDQEFAI